MDKFRYLVNAGLEETQKAIMFEVESILRASNNETGTLYGSSDKIDDDEYLITMHVGGAQFRILHRPQMRVTLHAQHPGVMASVRFARSWLDFLFHVVLILLGLAASITFYREGDTPKFIIAAAAVVTFVYSLVVAIYRERHETRVMLDYLQLCIHDAEQGNREESVTPET